MSFNLYKKNKMKCVLFPVLCHQCGSLFSGDGASDCVDFDPKESSTQKRCAAGEACLWYAWEKSKVGLKSGCSL